MPNPRVSELPQRKSPRLRTTSTSSDPNHLHRPITDRNTKLGLVRRSGGPHTDPLSQKKLGGRISGLESQLGQAQEELRLLKQQLAKAETAKKRAQEKLHKKPKKPNPLVELEGSETDVFEVPNEEIEVEKSKEDQINELKARLYDIEKEKLRLSDENESLKNQLKNMVLEMSNVKAKEDEMGLKMNQTGEDLEESNARSEELKKKIESMEETKEGLEAEIKKMSVQTKQWKKAADAAAEVLSRGVEINDLEKQFAGGFFESTAMVAGFGSSPGMADDSDGKRKGSGIKMLGDLWRKKGQK